MADDFLPPTGPVYGRESKPRSKRIYRCDDITKTIKFEDLGAKNGRATLLELPATVYQFILQEYDLAQYDLSSIRRYFTGGERIPKAMLKEYSALEQKLASKRAWYLKRAAKILPAAKALRWAQLENRMDLGLRLQLASAFPLVPAGKP